MTEELHWARIPEPLMPDCDGVSECYFCAAGELAREAAGGA